MNSSTKDIKVDQDNWEWLQVRKLNGKMKTVNDVITELRRKNREALPK